MGSGPIFHDHRGAARTRKWCVPRPHETPGMRCDIVRSTAGCALALALVNTAPAFAQTAAPRSAPSAKAVFQTPRHRSVHVTTLPGSVCNDPRVRAATANTLNPITGVQSGTVISIPLRKGPVDLKDATTRAQIARACAHH